MYSNPQTTTERDGPEPLPRGRHKLAAKDVRASQRRRLVQAMLECVAADGYAATTAQRVAARARVSPNTFYKFFRDKLECFLALMDQDADQLLGELYGAGDTETWVDAVRAGTRVYLNWWPARPQSSRAFLLELPAAGGEAVTRRLQIQERFLDLFRASAARARAEQPGLPPVSDAALRIHVAGMTELVASEVAAGRIDRLPQLEDELVHLTIKLLADDATAESARSGAGS
jgi:AcrR family transcriptional regulator